MVLSTALDSAFSQLYPQDSLLVFLQQQLLMLLLTSKNKWKKRCYIIKMLYIY